MVTYEEALEKARSLKEHIDECTEYENGYLFTYSGDEGYCGGYGHTSVVIWKKDGRATNYPEMVARGTGKEMRTFPVEGENTIYGKDKGAEN